MSTTQCQGQETDQFPHLSQTQDVTCQAVQLGINSEDDKGWKARFLRTNSSSMVELLQPGVLREGTVLENELTAMGLNIVRKLM